MRISIGLWFVIGILLILDVSHLALLTGVIVYGVGIVVTILWNARPLHPPR